MRVVWRGPKVLLDGNTGRKRMRAAGRGGARILHENPRTPQARPRVERPARALFSPGPSDSRGPLWALRSLQAPVALNASRCCWSTRRSRANILVHIPPGPQHVREAHGAPTSLEEILQPTGGRSPTSRWAEGQVAVKRPLRAWEDPPGKLGNLPVSAACARPWAWTFWPPCDRLPRGGRTDPRTSAKDPSLASGRLRSRKTMRVMSCQDGWTWKTRQSKKHVRSERARRTLGTFRRATQKFKPRGLCLPGSAAAKRNRRDTTPCDHESLKPRRKASNQQLM